MKTITENNTKSIEFNDEIIISVSHLGFIDRLPLAQIRSLSYGCDGFNAFQTRENDYVECVSLATINSRILFFTSFGYFYSLKVRDIPENISNSSECNVHDLLKIPLKDYIKVFIVVEDYTSADYLKSHAIEFCTKNGLVKTSRLMEFFRWHNGVILPRYNGIKAIAIRANDALADVVVTNCENELMLASREGRAIRYSELDNSRFMSRNSTGVTGMVFSEGKDDEIVGIININDVKEESVMFVCENGYGIRNNIEDFRLTYRCNLGVRAINVTNKTGKVIDIATVTDDTGLLFFSKSGLVNRIKVKNIPIKKRTTCCVKLTEMIPENDQIIYVLKTDDSNYSKSDL